MSGTFSVSFSLGGFVWLRIAITESEVEAKYIGLNPCQKILTKKTSRDKLGQRFLKKKKIGF